MDGLRIAQQYGSTQKDFSEVRAQPGPPDGLGAHDLLKICSNAGFHDPRQLLIIPIGGNQPDLTYRMRVWGWLPVLNSRTYSPLLLCEANVELGNIDGRHIDKQAKYMADTITLTPDRVSSVEVCSPTDDIQAHLLVAPMGSHFISFDWARNCRPPATIANALWMALE